MYKNFLLKVSDNDRLTLEKIGFGCPENGPKASGFYEKKCSKSGHRIRKNKKNKKNRLQDERYTGKLRNPEFE